MSEDTWIDVPVLKISQPIGDFYVGRMTAQNLVGICHADVRRFAGIESPESTEIDEGSIIKYIGIQRQLNPSRVNEIQQYVNTSDACFPNTIIIAISSKNIQTDDRSDRLLIRNLPNVANVIDGQHRLAGFDGNPTSTRFDLVATIFVDLEVAEQAYLFSTINTKQTRINPSLAQDLLDFSEIGTPEKVSHNIAKALNFDSESPWYHLIKMLGANDAIISGIITQHTFVVEVLNLMYPSEYQIKVRDELKRKNNKERLRGLDINSLRYPFWDFYVTNQDQQIEKILFNYFQAVKEVFPDDWANPRRILSKSVGYKALMLQLPELIRIGIEVGGLRKDFFLKPIRELRLGERELTEQEFGSSASGASKLREALFG